MKKTLLTLYFIALSRFCFAQALVKQWDYDYGADWFEYLGSFLQTHDSGFLLGGYSYSGIYGDKTEPSFGSFDYWLVKLDSSGQKLWDKSIGSTDNDEFTKAIELGDGKFVLLGRSLSDTNIWKSEMHRGFLDYWIVKTDSAGNKIWDKTLGGDFDDISTDIKPTPDGGFVIGGYSQSGASFDKTDTLRGSYDYWIVKIDSLGLKLWDKTLGGTSDDKCYSISVTPSGKIFCTGYSGSAVNGDKTASPRGGYDFWMVALDANGNKLWDKAYGSSLNDAASVISMDHSNRFLISGVSNSPVGFDKTLANHGVQNPPFYDYWIVCIDSNGTKNAEKVLGGNADDIVLNEVVHTSDNGWIFCGTSYSYPSGDKTEANLGPEQMWFIKTNSNLAKQWDKTVLTQAHEELGLATETALGCYVFANYTDAQSGGDKTQNTWGFNDYFITKWCDPAFGIIEYKYIYYISIQPNPAKDVVIADYFIPVGETNASISITSMAGNEIIHFIAHAGKHSASISIKELPTGIYILKLFVQHKAVVSKKLVVIK